MSVNKEDGNNNKNEVLVAVAHYIMVHYAEKETQKRCRKKYKLKSGQYHFPRVGIGQHMDSSQK
jgi:hypothetical protein